MSIREATLVDFGDGRGLRHPDSEEEALALLFQFAAELERMAEESDRDPEEDDDV
jgi:hypothetical protein